MKEALVTVAEVDPVERGEGFHPADLAKPDEIEVVLEDDPGDLRDLRAALVGVVYRRVHREILAFAERLEPCAVVCRVEKKVEILRVEGRDVEYGFVPDRHRSFPVIISTSAASFFRSDPS